MTSISNIRRNDYRYGVYRHGLIAPDGSVYVRPFIVIRNKYDIIVHFTNLHKFIDIYSGKAFLPLTSGAEKKMYYVCMMLNYVLIEYYDKFGIDDILQIDRKVLEQFFSDYALSQKTNGTFRSAQSIEKCVGTITMFFEKLYHKYGDTMHINPSDFIVEKIIRTKSGEVVNKNVSAFQVRGLKTPIETFRELPTSAFKILLNLAFRYAPDIVLAICLQAFAGLRAGEVCNVRQENSPLGGGIIFTRIGDDVRKIEIDISREICLRSDKTSVGRIKKERIQCVYPSFLDAFAVAYRFHCEYISGCAVEPEYRPMFVNERGKAMTYNDYSRRFFALVNKHFRPALIESDNAECKLYGQLLYENRLTLHSLRHWFTVQLVLYGEDIAQIQYWRGDRSPESAFNYLQNKGDLVRELERTSANFVDLVLVRGKIIWESKSPKL